MNRGFDYFDTVSRADDGRAAADFYAARWRHSDAAEWRARFERGEVVRAATGAALAPDEPVRAGDRLVWHRPPWEEPAVPTDWFPVFEDEYLLAVDKPAGLPCVPDGGFLENTLERLVNAARPGEKLVPAHRLGRGTSGLVLFSRTPAARRALAALFRDSTARAGGALRKIYAARTAPPPGLAPGARVEIDTPIGPVPHPALGSVHAATPHGKPARSVCTLRAVSDVSALWEVELVTGRPHQIRIHLASIGLPLLGDPLFLPGGVPRPDALPGDVGYFLRAIALDFPHPATGAPVALRVSLSRPCGAASAAPRGA